MRALRRGAARSRATASHHRSNASPRAQQKHPPRALGRDLVAGSSLVALEQFISDQGAGHASITDAVHINGDAGRTDVTPGRDGRETGAGGEKRRERETNPRDGTERAERGNGTQSRKLLPRRATISLRASNFHDEATGPGRASTRGDEPYFRCWRCEPSNV